uniref:Cytochrome P450 n=1 Tax=Kalanchoe fedtschenkoi TaxID=63787 RepID=A0A7N0RFI2_KALFE
MSTLAIQSATFLSLSLSLIWILFRSKITSPLTKWPLVGNFASLIFSTLEINDYAAYLLGLSDHTADLKGPLFTGIEFVLTSDPENIHYICGSNASNYYRGEHYKDVFEIWGDGILVAESQWWKFQRRLNHSLVRQSGFMSLVENATNRMLKDGLLPILDRAAELGFWVDMQDLSRRFTLELTCKFLLGIDLDSLSVDLPEVPFSKAIEDMEEAIFYRHLKPLRLWKLQRWLGIGVEGKSTKAKAILDEFVYRQISLKRDKIACKEGKEDEDLDMLSRFMAVREEALSHDQQAHNPNKNTSAKVMSDRFLRDSVVNMLTAGRDTTSVAFAWFFWLVSTHPSIEAKLRQELKEAFHLKEGDKWPYPTYQAMSKLVFLHGALCEALRLYPPVPFNRRTAIGPDTLPSGHRVDKGKEIIISTYTLGRMESVWGSDCLEFKPERWISDKGGIVHVTSNKFNAFSAGANQCLGKELAMLEMKMVAAAVVWNYHFEVVEGHSVDADSSIMYYMKHGLKVHVAKKV